MDAHRRRRVAFFFILCLAFAFLIFFNPIAETNSVVGKKPVGLLDNSALASSALSNLEVKSAASSDNYSRNEFGADWATTGGCDTRNIILNRDLIDVVVNSRCEVVSGKLVDPYTGKTINFNRGAGTSGDVQIDHVVALADAWRTGAWQFTSAERLRLANDPLELLAVDGKANMEKSDGDASVWLPLNKSFRCQYVARQIAVKQKYKLWVTQPEKEAINGVLSKCPGQMLPSP